MARRNGHQDGIGPDRLAQDALSSLVRLRKPGIESVVAQPAHLRCERRLEQADFHIGLLLPAQGQECREACLRDTVRQRDAQHAAIARGGGPDVGSCLFQHREHAAGIFQQHLARPGELGAAPIALEQRGAEVGLQLPDGARQRRLLDMEPHRRTREVQFLGHCHETAQVSQLHRATYAYVRPGA
ncbi:hypothetical protein FQZ97_966250 [compost metagenome]